MSIIIWLVFFFAFLTESIVGFWWLTIAFAVLSFFIETKDIVFLWLYVTTIASLSIIFTNHKAIKKDIFIKIFPVALIWTIIGIYLFSYFSSLILLNILSLLIILVSARALFFDSFLPENKIISNFFTLIWWLSQWLFWVWWPFFALSVQNMIKEKESIRATLAVFFVSFNIIRLIIMHIQWTIEYDYILSFWWLAMVIIMWVIVWYKIHLKIDKKTFSYVINIVLLLSGIILLLK